MTVYKNRRAPENDGDRNTTNTDLYIDEDMDGEVWLSQPGAEAGDRDMIVINPADLGPLIEVLQMYQARQAETEKGDDS